MSDFDRKDERDEFWNLDKLVPKRTKLNPFATSAPTVSYELPKSSVPEHSEGVIEPENERSDSDRRLSFSESTGVRVSEEMSYEPEAGGLIKRVTVRHFIDRYDFYDNFRKAALIYYDYKTEKCDFAQFYSYMPQYSQLSPAQRSYYFYWRSELRRGKYIRTDYSYVYLYVYEVLNLPDKIPPEEGVKLLCRLWREYRAALPRIDLYFSIWIQDYCLVHRLPCPYLLLSDFIFDVINAATFKEFYLSGVNPREGSGISAMLAYLSDYDWRRGKFVDGNPDIEPEKRREQRESYRRNIEGAMGVLLGTVWHSLLSGGVSKSTAIIARDAFPNSLCTHMVKRKLEIEYYPIAEADGLRHGITQALRYTENKQRALMGIKSRLAVKDLPDSYRKIIDNYFESLFDEHRRIAARECAPEYEKLYSAPREKLSFAGADEIERLSWDTTLRLVDGTEDEDAEEAVTENTESLSLPSTEIAMVEDTDSDSSIESDADTYGLSDSELSFIGYILGENADASGTAVGISDTATAERINEAFSDGFGDIILEFDGEKYSLIDDYKEEILEWFRKITK